MTEDDLAAAIAALPTGDPDATWRRCTWREYRRHKDDDRPTYAARYGHDDEFIEIYAVLDLPPTRRDSTDSDHEYERYADQALEHTR
jgi:hypothetical protein